MKTETLIIAFFLFIMGLMVVGAKLYVNQFAMASDTVAELLTDSYVQENILNSTGQFDENEKTYTFNNESHSLPINELRKQAYKAEPAQNVLGATTEEKKIIVDLEHQRVYAYEGSRLVFNFLVSTGKYGATPVGSYRIWYKVRSQVMKGGNRELGTYYYLPNVQWIQYFNQGIGLHSTYWHNNFGHPMSHGCVNMTTTDSETIYHWATPVMMPGTRIFRAKPDNPGTRVEVVKTWTI
jgi:lipoprotein-anchoring transpeptidase ErfK/SrfK